MLGDSIAGDGVKDRKVDLFVGCVEIDEEVIDFADHLVRARILAVDLVDDDDYRQLLFEGFGEDVACLRQRAFRCVDQQYHAVRKFQDTLDLASKIGVAWRVENIDLGPLIADRGILRHDRDPALALEIH